MRDFNINIRETTPESHKLDEFCSLFSLTNIIKSNTCFAKFHSSTIDLFLTNGIKTGLGNHPKLICHFFKFCYDGLKPKTVYYRNYKKFNETNFLKDIKNCDFSLKTDDPSETTTF